MHHVVRDRMLVRALSPRINTHTLKYVDQLPEITTSLLAFSIISSIAGIMQYTNVAYTNVDIACVTCGNAVGRVLVVAWLEGRRKL